MDADDMTNVTTLCVPKNQHITEVILRSNVFINQLGFATNEKVVLSVGNESGGFKHEIGQLIKNHYPKAKQWYLHGIKGITVQTSESAPCGAPPRPTIAQIQFVYIVILDLQ